MKRAIIIATSFSIIVSCQQRIKEDKSSASDKVNNPTIVQPVIITEEVKYDTDDPAIWLHPQDPAQSFIIGTDKKTDGALYAFNLEGKIIDSLVIRDLKYPNNVDIAYGLKGPDHSIDIAVVTERENEQLRIFSMPDMQPIDGGGIAIFEGESEKKFRAGMGIALYTKPETQEIYAIVSRKKGPTDGTYLWQYQLNYDGNKVTAELVRKFGQYSGKKEIEAIAIDNELGFIYYSDELYGVRKYYADPTKGNDELALFATEGFSRDREGISIFKNDDGTGYILVSDQQSNAFHIFPREGNIDNPHQHKLIKKVFLAALNSDGSDVTPIQLNDTFKHGLFVAMSTDKTFHLYRWEDIIGEDLLAEKDDEISNNSQIINPVSRN